MKAAILSALLLFIGSLPAFCQTSLMETIFLPPRFFVGDRVELRLKYDLAAGVLVEPPEQLPADAWIELQDIEVQDKRSAGRGGEVLVRIYFIPFNAGETVLPSIRLGELDTGELLVTTQSALQLEQDQTLRGPRRQLSLPMSWLRLLALVVIAIGAPMCLLFLLRYGIKGLARVREARLRRLPYVHARKSLNQLTSGRSSMEGKSFFILLSLTIRRYLTERLAVPLMSATTGEIIKELSRAGLEDAVSLRIQEELKAADLIKFSGKRANRREMEKRLKAADRIVEQVEERTNHVEV